MDRIDEYTGRGADESATVTFEWDGRLHHAEVEPGEEGPLVRLVSCWKPTDYNKDWVGGFLIEDDGVSVPVEYAIIEMETQPTLPFSEEFIEEIREDGFRTDTKYGGISRAVLNAMVEVTACEKQTLKE